jgi:hypothetical protein
MFSHDLTAHILSYHLAQLDDKMRVSKFSGLFVFNLARIISPSEIIRDFILRVGKANSKYSVINIKS